MSLHYHEISESNHRILNPFTAEQITLLGEICRPQAGQRMLDLGCGKAELLCQWARAYGIQATGVDLSPIFLEAARQRAAELGVADQLTFVETDAGQFPIEPGAFDIIGCIGATWVGGGLLGTLELMRPGLRDADSLLLVGEPYWIEEPPDEAVEWLAGGDRDAFVSMPATVEKMESTGLELVEMVLADHYGWDRYESKQWLTLSDWLRQNSQAPDVEEIRQGLAKAKRDYMTYGRRYLGWGVFVLRPQ